MNKKIKIIQSQNISKIPHLPTTLTIFGCSGNNISKIENLPQTLIFLLINYINEHIKKKNIC